MHNDLANQTVTALALAPAVRTADANGATLDLTGYRGCTLVAALGAAGDTLSGSVKIELEVEHSDNGSSWADCADTDLTVAVTGTNTGTFAVVDADAEAGKTYATTYVGGKKYCRIVENVTGTHTNGTGSGAVAILTGSSPSP